MPQILQNTAKGWPHKNKHQKHKSPGNASKLHIYNSILCSLYASIFYNLRESVKKYHRLVDNVCVLYTS